MICQFSLTFSLALGLLLMLDDSQDPALDPSLACDILIAASWLPLLAFAVQVIRDVRMTAATSTARGNQVVPLPTSDAARIAPESAEEKVRSSSSDQDSERTRGTKHTPKTATAANSALRIANTDYFDFDDSGGGAEGGRVGQPSAQAPTMKASSSADQSILAQIATRTLLARASLCWQLTRRGE